MKRFLFLFAILMSAVSFSQCPVIPTPTEYEAKEAYFMLPDTLTFSGSMSVEEYAIIAGRFKKQFGVHLRLAKEDADVYLKQDDFTEGEVYDLKVGEEIKIYSHSSHGAFNAWTTLFQLIHKIEDGWAIQHCKIKDEPRFNWRGLHLDVSRHYFSIEDIKAYIDHMSLYKFNKFHWHLTDDQGWRIEIKKYPKLTEVGAYRDSTVIGHYTDKPRRYEVSKYGGFYSQEEVKEIVQYAKARHIEVIPEIEMPGHSRAALAAYPEYSCTGEWQPVPGLWGIFDDIYCSKDETIDFMTDILDEVLELFPSEYIHIGGDEAPKTRWKSCENCQKVIRKNNLKDEHELQSYFIRRIDDYLTENGRKLIGWDEILEGGLSPNATVMSWRGESGGIEAAKQGHDVVMSPTTYCYFDYYQSGHDIEPVAIGGYLPLQKVYSYELIPAELNEDQAKHILGGQANLWTEYMPNMDHVEYMAYPRSLALIQSLWCMQKPSYEEFISTYLTYQEGFMTRNEINFSNSIHYPDMKIRRSRYGIDISFVGVSFDEEFKLRTTEHNGESGAGGDRTIKAGEKITIERPAHGETEIEYVLSSSSFDGEIKYRIEAHDDIGRKIDLITPPHPKYDHNGSTNLVDGIRGGKKFKGSDWLGFQEQSVEFIVDMERNANLTGIEVGLLERNGSWIYLPESVVVEVSNNREDWSLGANESIDERNYNEGRLSIDLSGEARFIKVKFLAMERIPEGMSGGGHVPWTFIDEVQIVEKK